MEFDLGKGVLMSREIFFKAAQIVQAGVEECSCEAVVKAGGMAHNERFKYRATFSPWTDRCGGFWLHYAMKEGLISKRDMKKWRITALCFAAAMAEAGDL